MFCLDCHYTVNEHHPECKHASNPGCDYCYKVGSHAAGCPLEGDLEKPDETKLKQYNAGVRAYNYEGEEYAQYGYTSSSFNLGYRVQKNLLSALADYAFQALYM